MAKFDKAILAEKYGITGVTEVLYNPSYEVLFNEEMKPELEGFDKGQETELGAINVMTGIYTGRSPKDKFIVDDANSHDKVWWTTPGYPNDNKPVTEATWSVLKDLAVKQLSGKRLFVVDGFCGANKDTRMKVRFIMEVAWQAHFVTNMFIRPQNEEEFDQEPDFTVYCASKAKVDNFKELGLASITSCHYTRDARSYSLRRDEAGITRTELRGNGDFASPEGRELMSAADVVCTNPPFSLYREFITQVKELGKDYLLIGPMVAIEYKCTQKEATT